MNNPLSVLALPSWREETSNILGSGDLAVELQHGDGELCTSRRDRPGSTRRGSHVSISPLSEMDFTERVLVKGCRIAYANFHTPSIRRTITLCGRRRRYAGHGHFLSDRC